MRVFISWSKERSKLVAELFSGWIKCVIQSVHPWISTQDIQDGELWFPAISNQVAEISTGVIFITEENKNEPWVLFEAGGLAKGLDKSRLVLFLIDLESKDLLLSPLTAFNQTKNDKEGVRKLVGNINKWIPAPLDPQTLDTVFDKFWPDFEKDFARIIKDTEVAPIAAKGKATAPSDINNDILVEILKTVRSLQPGNSPTNPIIFTTKTNKGPVNSEEERMLYNFITNYKTNMRLDDTALPAYRPAIHSYIKSMDPNFDFSINTLTKVLNDIATAARIYS